MTDRDDTTSSLVEYRDILDFPGYRISRCGCPQSCRMRGTRTRGGQLIAPWRDMKVRVNERWGHRFVDLRRDGRNHRCYIHRLILEAFVGPCPEGQECRHIDGDPANNNLDNLAWGTPAENQADRVRHGTSNRGERHGLSKLTVDKVIEIRRRVAGGMSRREAAATFGIHQTCVDALVNRKTWTHVP